MRLLHAQPDGVPAAPKPCLIDPWSRRVCACRVEPMVEITSKTRDERAESDSRSRMRLCLYPCLLTALAHA